MKKMIIGKDTIRFEDLYKKWMKNPNIKREYDKLQPDFAVIRAIIRARADRGITQKELASRIGTKQSVISRLEVGGANPSVAFLKKFAQALQTRLEINFTPL